MTKEELEKEAEETYQKTDKEFMGYQDEGEIFNLGYLAGAEPREKCIEKLEKENAELKEQHKTDLIQLQAILNQRSIQNMKLTKAKEIMNIAVEGVKHWGVVGGTERPFEKQAEKLFNLFLDKSEQFISEVDK